MLLGRGVCSEAYSEGRFSWVRVEASARHGHNTQKCQCTGEIQVLDCVWRVQIQALIGHDENYQIAVDKVASLTEVRPAVLSAVFQERILQQHLIELHVF